MTNTTSHLDDFVAGFSPQALPVHGRVATLGRGTLSPILARHDYPEFLGEILGEAMALAALVGSGMKFNGRILVQAEGDGPVSMLVGEYRKDGGLRAYAKFDRARWDRLIEINKGDRPHLVQLFGAKGALGLIIVHDDPKRDPYQGVVALNKATLAECAEDYFRQSEQIDTHLKLSVRSDGEGGWNGGAMMIQRLASDAARGDTQDGWLEAEALFSTLSDEELTAPDLPVEDLLFRLFHEGGVRIEARESLVDLCTCNEDRLRATLSGMPDASLRELVEPDGTLSIDCQFCGRKYTIPVGDVTGQLS